MAEKMYIFEPDQLMRLFTHYTDGVVPLDAEVTNVGVNPYLTRFIGFEVMSKEWGEPQLKNGVEYMEPLHLRYEGKRVMRFTANQGAAPKWDELNETPKRQ